MTRFSTVKAAGFTLALTTFISLSAQATTITWTGCGISKKAFMSELAAAYEAETGNQIELSGGGATKGIRQVANNESDMGGTCRHKIPNADEEIEAKLIPVAWDALAVIVHPTNPITDISSEELRQIYVGNVTNWSEIGGPDQPINLMIRKGKISGVGRTIRELLFDNPELEFSEQAQVYKSTGPLEETLETTTWGLAITGISSAKRRDVKILALDGSEPSYDNIKSGDYLLYRPLYIAANPKGSNYPAVQEFVNYAHSTQGRKIIRKAGSVPYLDAIHLVRNQRKQWQDIRKNSPTVSANSAD